MDEKKVQDTVVEMKRAYYREYYKKNREKIKERNKRYWERKAELLLKGKEDPEDE